MTLRFAEVSLQALLELGLGRILDHFGQGFHDLVFGVVDVLQRMGEQVIHRLDVF